MTWTALYATLLDHYRWGLDTKEDTKKAAQVILDHIAAAYNVPSVVIEEANVTSLIQKFTDIIARKMENEKEKQA